MTSTREKTPVDLDSKGEIFRDTPMSSTADLFEDGSVDPVYQAKARVLNDAFQEIGMGKYQVRALSRSADRIRKAERGGIVVPLHRRRLWLVLVSVTLVI